MSKSLRQLLTKPRGSHRFRVAMSQAAEKLKLIAFIIDFLFLPHAAALFLLSCSHLQSHLPDTIIPHQTSLCSKGLETHNFSCVSRFSAFIHL
jgi:hypothetical protein